MHPNPAPAGYRGSGRHFARLPPDPELIERLDCARHPVSRTWFVVQLIIEYGFMAIYCDEKSPVLTMLV